jgi:Tol biopolymer transport system component
VLVDLQAGQIFFELDPIQGKGAELIRLDYTSVEWSLSPDGRRIALTPQEQAGHIVLVDLAGGVKQDIVVETPGLALLDAIWSADGGGFFVSAFSGGEYLLLHVDLQGQATVLLAHGHQLRKPTHSPDGRHLAFQVWTSQSNAWLLGGY